MIICRNCNTPMENVMSFSKDKNEKFHDVPNALVKQSTQIYKLVN